MVDEYIPYCVQRCNGIALRESSCWRCSDDDRADSSEAATVTKPPDAVVLSTLNPFLEVCLRNISMWYCNSNK